jgi:hypothetical protein
VVFLLYSICSLNHPKDDVVRIDLSSDGILALLLITNFLIHDVLSAGHIEDLLPFFLIPSPLSLKITLIIFS